MPTQFRCAKPIEYLHSIRLEHMKFGFVQVYKGFDVGSAKVSVQEMQGVPHHLLSVNEPEELMNVQAFARLARETVWRLS